MNIRGFLKSIRNANRGLKYVFMHEKNFRLQIFAALIVLLLIFYFDVSTIESLILLLCIALVVTLELVNSAIELLIDLFKPRFSQKIKVVKDILASAVYVFAFFSMIIGIIVFYPYFIEYLQG